MKNLLTSCSFLLCVSLYAQSDLPYDQIPDYPETYSAETAVARMVDGLGFRYFWATEGLRDQDLAYSPSDGARTSRETLEHIHGLTQLLINCTLQQAHVPEDVSEYSFDELRKETLHNIKEVSMTLRSGEVILEDLLIRFESTDTTYPFWNQINGPIADAIWHVGQVVSFRRSSGNPFNSKASVFHGKLRD